MAKPPRPDQADAGGAARAPRRGAGRDRAPRTGRAAGRTRCRSGTWSATATSGPGPSPSRRRSGTSSATRAARCWSRPAIEYDELRGIQIEAEAELIRDPEQVVEFGEELTIRYAEGIDEIEGDAAAGLRGAGAEAGGDPLPPGPDRDLGPPQARRHLLGIGSAGVRASDAAAPRSSSLAGRMENLKGLVLSGGAGTRLRPITHTTRQAARAGRQQARALLRARGDGRRRHHRDRDHHRARDRRRDPRGGRRRLARSAPRSPTSSRTSRWASPTRC